VGNLGLSTGTKEDSDDVLSKINEDASEGRISGSGNDKSTQQHTTYEEPEDFQTSYIAADTLPCLSQSTPESYYYTDSQGDEDLPVQQNGPSTDDNLLDLEKRQFNAWGGKRSFNAWGGKRSFNAWGGKRSFNAWGGKRSSNFNPWGGKRSFNAWGGKRSAGFDPWGGKRSYTSERNRRLYSQLLDKKSFNAWG
jgi:hypothetical protein